MPRNSVNPIIYGKAVPSDHIKNLCFSWMSVFPSIECSIKNSPKYGNKKRLVEQKQDHTTQSVSINQS